MYDKLTTEELTEKAEQLEESGKLVEALEYWRAAVQRDSDPVSLCQFGNLARTMGKWSEAEGALVLAANLAPELPNPYTLLGFLYLDQDMLEEAMSYFQKALEIEQTAAGLTSLGMVQLELGLNEDERASLKEAIRIDPNYEEAYYNLGLTYHQDQRARAVELLAKAVQLDSEYAMAHRELGWALRHPLLFTQPTVANSVKTI